MNFSSKQGQFPFDRLLKFYDFRAINQAIANARRGDTIKPVLRVDEPLGVESDEV